MRLADRIETVLSIRPQRQQPLHGGSIGEVYRVDFPDGERIVAKVAGTDGTLDIEGYMLRYLNENSVLPVPQVLHAEKSLLLMTFIEGRSDLNNSAQAHAADLLAALHDVRAEQFGHERDTLIGPLHQPNPLTGSWVVFFREWRLLHMAKVAREAGQLPRRLYDRIRSFAADLDDYLEEPPHPALIHGDMWTTNILAQDGRVTGVVDPAIYYAHPEMELAYTTLFGTFGDPFFRRYRERRVIAPGFFEQRRDIYNLYPLLVHVRLFGGGYAARVDRTLTRLGY